MIKLNRTTEYGLMALRHMSRKCVTEPNEVTSAREIADAYGFPFEITAKTLQRLKDTGLIGAAHGARGGYSLLKSLDNVTLAEFLKLMEGPQTVVPCASPQVEEKPPCEYHSRCEISQVMGDLNSKVWNFLTSIKLAELTDGNKKPNVSFIVAQDMAVGGEP